MIGFMIDKYRYRVSEFVNYQNQNKSQIRDNFDNITDDFMQYVSGLFKGLDKKNVDINTLFNHFVSRKFGTKGTYDFYISLNASKISKAGSLKENSLIFEIWDSEFDKTSAYYFFKEPRTIEEFTNEFGSFDYISKLASDRFYFTETPNSDNVYGDKLNLYYCDFFIDKKDKKSYNVNIKNKNGNGIATSYSSVSMTQSEADKRMEELAKTIEEEYKRNKGEKIMNGSNFGRTITAVANANKDAAKQAAMIKIGDTATQTVVNILKEKALPKKYKKVADSPVFNLVVANTAAVAMKQFVPNRNDKTDAIADAMILASMVKITNMVDINAILKEVIDSVDLTGLVGKDGE